MELVSQPDPSAPNGATALARVLFDELARCGVHHVVVCPGSRSTALAVAAHDHPDLLVHVEVDERSAAYLAVGIGRATGEPAAVVVTSGTAVANLLPACVEAHHDRVPLLLLTADRPPELLGTGANQTIDQSDIFGSNVRWSVDLGLPLDEQGEVARWRWTACRAHGTAVGRPVEVPAVVSLDAWQAPGPVHLNLPFREPTVPATDDGRTSSLPYRQPLDGRDGGEPWVRSEVEPHVPARHVLESLHERLASSPHGVVLVGGAVDGGLGPVLEVAADLGWPVIAEPHAPLPSSDGVLQHPTLLLGTGFARSSPPEVVLRIGRTTVARETQALLDGAPRIVVVDAHGGWADPDDPRVERVRGHVAQTLSALRAIQTGRPTDRRDPAWRTGWLAADTAVGEAVQRVLGDARTTMEAAVVRAVAGALPAQAALVVGSSMPIRHLDLVGPRRPDVHVVANRGVSGIDGVVSTALGVSLGWSGPTVAVVGDLTLLHDSNAWLLSPDPAGRSGDLVVVVLDNDGGAIFSLLPQRTHVGAFERLFGTPHGRDLGHLARLHDLGLHEPTTPDGVATAVLEGLREGGRHLVVVRTDRAATPAHVRELREAAAAAVSDGGPAAG